jgi:uncharacterized membrane protein YccC
MKDLTPTQRVEQEVRANAPMYGGLVTYSLAKQLATELEQAWQQNADLLRQKLAWSKRIKTLEQVCQDIDQKRNDLLKDKERVILEQINRADCAADNMEGANGPEFTVYELRMSLAVDTLESLGVHYNPMTGVRTAIAHRPTI